MILFNNILQTCNSYVGNGDHTVPLAHHKYNRIIIGKNIRLTGEGLGYTLTAMPTDDKLTKVRILTRAVKLMGIEPNVV